MENKVEQRERCEPSSTELPQSLENVPSWKSSSKCGHELQTVSELSESIDSSKSGPAESDPRDKEKTGISPQSHQLEIIFISLFPEAIRSALSPSLLGKAQDTQKVRYQFVPIRSFGRGKHRQVDDAPYGGGEGMILRADVLYEAYQSIEKRPRSLSLLLSPQGKRFDQPMAKKLSQFDQLIVICGHYEGLDERFIKKCIDLELSIGDYILTGGESAAIVVADCVTRLLPGVVGKRASIEEESLENGLLKYPQYTRPYEFEGMQVPEVLISGDHQKIQAWRSEARLQATQKKRPDLFEAWENRKSD